MLHRSRRRVKGQPASQPVRSLIPGPTARLESRRCKRCLSLTGLDDSTWRPSVRGGHGLAWAWFGVGLSGVNRCRRRGGLAFRGPRSEHIRWTIEMAAGDLTVISWTRSTKKTWPSLLKNRQKKVTKLRESNAAATIPSWLYETGGMSNGMSRFHPRTNAALGRNAVAAMCAHETRPIRDAGSCVREGERN